MISWLEVSLVPVPVPFHVYCAPCGHFIVSIYYCALYARPHKHPLHVLLLILIRDNGQLFLIYPNHMFPSGRPYFMSPGPHRSRD